MSLPVRNTFKIITTSLIRGLTKHGIEKNTISFNFAKNLRCNSACCSINTKKNSCLRDSLFTTCQCEKNKKERKVTIVGGGGRIGQLTAYDIVIKKFCDEIVLFDAPSNTSVHGVGMDMLGGVSLRNHPNVKVCTTGELTRDSDLLILCVGKGVSKGQTRLDALQDNIEIFRKLIPKLVYFSPDSVLLITTNPVDIMTYVAWKFSGFPFQRVIGTGTELDTSRFKYILSKRLGISPKYINAWIIGEHGLSCVPCWSTINIAGTRLREIHPRFGLKDDPENWSKIEEEVKQFANDVKAYKGFTSYSIAMATSKMAQAILTNAKTIHAVSTCCNGVYGFKATSFLSLPAVIGQSGVISIVRQCLDCEEKEKLLKSVAIVDKALLEMNV